MKQRYNGSQMKRHALAIVPTSVPLTCFQTVYFQSIPAGQSASDHATEKINSKVRLLTNAKELGDYHR